jgi:4,5-DOPA dioxygenase extradiol
MTNALPALFLSHGSPMLALEPSEARTFLAGLGRTLGTPKAIAVASAHWGTGAPLAGGAVHPETIHDFGGFPRALYQMQYPAPGAPGLATRIAGLLNEAGFAARVDPGYGLDHGAWVPLSLLYPEADVPVVQVSIQPDLGPRHHFRLGVALAALRQEGVLVIGSGGMTHNLHEFRGQPAQSPEQAYVTEFADWMAERILASDREALADYRAQAPHARRAHPTDEHLLPLFVAMGASTGPGRRLHASQTHGILAMDVYAFD